MSNFTFERTPLEGLLVVRTKRFHDERGCFMETYHRADFEAALPGVTFVQDNQSTSRRGVVRGLHFQRRHPQGKLVRVLQGEVFDVAVDLRRGSPTFGRPFGMFLSGEDGTHLYIPPGFAHGFLALSERADVLYKCTDFYRPGDEGGILWNDPALGIDWPTGRAGLTILSAKDAALKPLAETDLGF